MWNCAEGNKESMFLQEIINILVICWIDSNLLHSEFSLSCANVSLFMFLWCTSSQASRGSRSISHSDLTKYYYVFPQKLDSLLEISVDKKCSYSELFCSPFFAHFPAFGLNMERYSVSLHIQSECGKMQKKCRREKLRIRIHFTQCYGQYCVRNHFVKYRTFT